MNLHIATSLPVGNYQWARFHTLTLPLRMHRPWREIANEVAHKHDVPVEKILGACSSHPVVVARWDLMMRLYGTGRSLPRIGMILNKHHTTVLYGIRQWKRKFGA